jgi:glucokinase
MVTTDFVLAADIGGTHITAALVNITSRKLLQPTLVRSHVDAAGSVAEIIAAWSSCLSLAKKDADVSKICLAMPGPFDYQKGVSRMQGQGKYDSLYKCNVKELLAEELKIDPENIFTENDAACFLQGEVFAGCAADCYNKVIGVTLGTGLGTAVYKNGRSRSADLWCFPFRESIAEDYLATRWFLQRYSELSGKTVSGVKDLAEKAEKDPVAQSVFNEFGKTLAEFLFHFIDQEKPEAVVIAGNIANAYELFRHQLEAPTLKHFPSVHLKQSVLGEGSALLGAAGSWYNATQNVLLFS